ncbi:hypothetical protein ML437_00175 [Staphylococcus roterodami]|nr:hypothetical protein ML437_00175 [Staphylococcus roterodami]
MGVIVIADCYGIALLLNVKDENGRFLIDNRKMTGFSNSEKFLANRNSVVPFVLESAI